MALGHSQAYSFTHYRSPNEGTDVAPYERDCYWVSRSVTGTYYAEDLDTFPAAGTRTFVCVGDLVYGWLNDSTTDLKYENI